MLCREFVFALNSLIDSFASLEQNVCSFRPSSISHFNAKDFSYQSRCFVEQAADIFSPSSLLPSLSLAFLSLTTLSLIFPRFHQPLLISLPLCSHFCLSNTSPSVFFFLSMSVLILPRVLLLPEALPRPVLCCCNDTDKLFGHSSGFVSHPHVCFNSVLSHLVWFRLRMSYVNLARHIGQSDTHRTHTRPVYTLLILLSAKLRDSLGNMT